ncbi:MAG: hypothetical protein OXO52_02955 [Rhodospirillales bacterium]|nr:hypothetical protein [Rhodospirillales bacterium]MDE0377633.1 hypothetical protein [Rhodospirillales bacterium]
MTGTDTTLAPAAPTRTERAFVLAGFALAAIWTAVAAGTGASLETAGTAWLAAILWTVFASLACALARGIRRRDWSAFTGYRLPGGRDERIDAATQSGQYAFIEVAEEHERLMRGD